jgi:ATP-dependent RNA helicase DDX24/MAK5
MIQPGHFKDLSNVLDAIQQANVHNTDRTLEPIDFDSDAIDRKTIRTQPASVARQTFIFSATLTLPASVSYTKSSHNHSNKMMQVEGAIAEILERSRAIGKTKIVDLVGGSQKAAVHEQHNVIEEKSVPTKMSLPYTRFVLPNNLSFEIIKCTQKHKDLHLYARLMTDEQRDVGTSLVFCNSIAGVRRVGSILGTLGIQVKLLHAQMQQVRFQNTFASCLLK